MQNFTSHSLSGQQWRMVEAPEHHAREIALVLGVPEVLARVLAARGITAETAEAFLAPSLKVSLPNPSHLKDMDAAALRLARAVEQKETIAIFGDYDVDGATSTALLARYFRAVGATPLLYIPDRIKEGYGPNLAAFLQLKERGAKVIITVDCGTLAFDAIAAASEAGVDVIVADHHQGEARLPRALAVINPNRVDETSPHRHMAAVGVSFLLAVAVNRQLKQQGYFTTRREPDLLGLLDLAALGTVCDVVSLTGVNRALTAQGLKVMAARGNAGLSALMDVSRLEERPTAYHAGFILGPRVNAGGRVGCADYGARLLSEELNGDTRMLAEALNRYNEERKAIEAMVLEEAEVMAAAQHNEPMLLLAKEGWHPGVIGIVAGRIKERTHKPVAVVAMSGGVGKASARSVSGFDFGAAVIAACELKLLVSGGGHAMAAGFSVEAGQLPALHEFFNRRVLQSGVCGAARVLKLDACVALSGITPELAHALDQAAPFGAGNPAPRIAVQHATVAQVVPVGQNHLRVILAQEKTRVTAMAFRAGGTAYGNELQKSIGKTVHAAGTLKLRHWQGREDVQFTLEDAALA